MCYGEKYVEYINLKRTQKQKKKVATIFEIKRFSGTLIGGKVSDMFHPAEQDKHQEVFRCRLSQLVISTGPTGEFALYSFSLDFEKYFKR